MYTIVMRVTAWQIKSISEMSESHQLGQIYPGVGIEKILLTFPLSTTYMEALEVLLYFDETQNVNVNFLISAFKP